MKLSIFIVRMKIGTSTKNMAFKSDNYKFSPTQWLDINFDVSTLSFGFGSNPDIINLGSSDIGIAAFAGTGITTEEVSGGFELNHFYKEGTAIRPHIHWAPTTTGSGNVVWQLEYSWCNDGDVCSTGTIITVTDAAPGTAWQQQIVEFPTIDGTGKTIGSQFSFRLFRDPANGSDTYEDDAVVKTFGVHVEADSIGSREVISK